MLIFTPVSAISLAPMLYLAAVPNAIRTFTTIGRSPIMAKRTA